MYMLVKDLMQNATELDDKDLTEITSSDLKSYTEISEISDTPNFRFKFAKSSKGYNKVNAVGVVSDSLEGGGGINRLRVDYENKVLKEYTDILPDKYGMNRWLGFNEEFFTFRTETIDLREVDPLDPKANQWWLYNRQPYGMNWWLGKTPLDTKGTPVVEFTYIHLFLFKEIELNDDKIFDLFLGARNSEVGRVYRVAIGYAHKLPTSNKIEFGINPGFKYQMNAIGGQLSKEEQYYSRVVNCEIPYKIDKEVMEDFESAASDLLTGLPVFCYFNEDKLPVDYFYGTIDKFQLNTRVRKTLFSTKLKIEEAF